MKRFEEKRKEEGGRKEEGRMREECLKKIVMNCNAMKHIARNQIAPSTCTTGVSTDQYYL